MADDTTDPDTSAAGASPEPTEPAPADDAAAEETAGAETAAEDAEDAGATEAAPTVSVAPVSARPAGNPLWPQVARVAGVAAIYLLLAAVAGGLGWKLWSDHRVDRAGTIAQDTAVDYAQVLTSISSDQVDENFAAVLNGATGDFKDMYTESSMRLRQLLIDNKSDAHGKVVDSAVQSKSTDKVVVLLMVDQKVENTELPDPRVDSLRMKMTMEKVDGRWLASKVELP
ncbi:Mce protein [Mycobacterium sp. 1274756.6]|uniref:Mce protein n=1 Tax=Mycobacterium sp. 1274756.6 TaxID=1834076 RepID=UPI000B0B20A1|nr:Mce protein [Mycobacterium sp. 1274756.6]